MSAAKISASLTERTAILSVVGLEYYDFVVMALLAPYLAKAFFSNSSHTWVSILGIYAAGAWCRPIGAIFWGHFSDRLGRKKPLIGAAAIMFLASLCIGLLPIHLLGSTIAVSLLLFLRMLQGFALGGDSSIVATLIAEKSPESKRGFYLGFIYSANCAASAIASLLIYTLSLHFNNQQMISFGWRIPFLFGAALLLIFTILRAKIVESKLFVDEPIRHKFPIIASIRHYYRQLLLGISVGLLGNVLVGLSMYVPSYLHHYYHWQVALISIVLSISLVYLAILYPITGWLSDKMTRKRLLILSCIIFLILLWPMFMVLGQHSLVNLLLFMIMLKTFTGLGIICAQIIYTEIFPTPVRTTGVATVNNITGALGGTMPVALSALAIGVGFVKGPELALVVACLITLLAAFALTDQTGKSLSTIKREVERH